jgi:putative endopeptidase
MIADLGRFENDVGAAAPPRAARPRLWYRTRVTTPRLRLAALLLLAPLASIACDAEPPAAPPQPPPPAATAAPASTGPGSIDLAAMDKSVRPGVDFFMYANGAWYANARIAPDRTYTGVDLRIQEEVELRTRSLLEDAAKASAAADTSTQRIGDYYASSLDEARIESLGIAPLKPTLDKIAQLKTAKDLAAYFGAELRADVDVLNSTNLHTDRILGLWVEQDLNDSSKNAPYLLQGGVGLPDRSYYLEDGPRTKAQREAYLRHLAAMLKLAGVADADKKAARVVDLETQIAKTHANRVDTEDVSKGNNPWSRADFDKKAPGMDWAAFFGAAGLAKQGGYIVWQPSAVTGLAKLVKTVKMDVWRDYLVARAIDRAAPVLPKAFVDESFAFYGKTLNGAEELAPRWRRAADATTDALGDALGHAYVDKYFPPETKKACEVMVQNLVVAMGRRIDALAWMAPATKAKAKEKLATLKVGVGYPDTWRDDTGLVVKRGDAFGNLQRAELFEYQRNVAKLGKPVDRGEWAMVAHVVNAVNLPVRNALNFPAAILSPPFFDPKATAAANYGSIGATIGHEISHSFDDQGAKFDAHGKYTNWWTPEDLAHFEASSAALAAQFDAYMPFRDAHIDGKQTLSENIADLAGIAIAYDAWKASLGGKEAPVENGLTGDQQFFLSYAQGWQMKQRDETLRQRLKTDGHAPAHWRVFTVRNVDAWYPAFEVLPTDPLFLQPAARVRIW